jgi:hypothetical protein
MPACGFGLSSSLYSLRGLNGLSNMLGDVPSFAVQVRIRSPLANVAFA